MRRAHTTVLVAAATVALLASACSQAGSGVVKPRGGAVQPATGEDIRRPANDVPEPIGSRAADRVVIHMETREVEGQLADGTTYEYWTFGGTVPGPLLRIRVGDTVELHLANSAESGSVHSIDLHAVNGPGGGAVATQVAPGEEKSFTFRALNPGLYVYHCASPHIPSHVANGMYGLILVEPAGGLSRVDREFYVVQGEIYTRAERGTKGHVAYDAAAMIDEQPTYVVFNGAVQALTDDRAMEAKVGDRVRIFVGNGGPNLISSFHVIGEVFEAVHAEGATEAQHNVQTTLIPAGGAAWVEFTVDVPGRYILVDHALTRALDGGAVGFLEVEGPAEPGVFDAPEADGS